MVRKNKTQKKKPVAPQEPKPISTKPWVIIVSILLIVLVGFVAYANSFNGQFLYDDPIWIQENHSVTGGTSFWQMLTTNIGAGADRNYNFYRPLTIFSLAVNYHWAGFNVTIYHLTNLAFHLGVALCVYWLVNILFAQNLLALLTAVFFVAHPIQTEAVCYISGRSDSMYVFFLLMAFILYIKDFHPRVVNIALILLSYILAILSKENAVLLPFLVLLYHGIFGKFKLAKFTSLVLITVGYGILRATLLNFPAPQDGFHSTFLDRVPGFFVAITNYTRLLLLPLHLHMEYGSLLFDWSTPKALVGVLLVGAAATAVFSTFKTNRLIAFAIAWFFVALMPESNLYQINAYMYEHWLYLPSAGFCLILAYFLNRLYQQEFFKVVAVMVMALLVGFYVFLTFKQADYWKDPASFYERTLKYAPFSARLDNNLGLLYSNEGKYKEAIDLFKKAIALKPQYPEANNNLAVVYANLNQYDKAIEYFQKTLKLDNAGAEINFAGVYSNLGNSYARIGKIDKAITAFQKAIELNPDLASSYNNLALLDEQIGKTQEARQLFEKAENLDRQNPTIKFNLGSCYAALKMNDKALNKFREVTILDDHNAAAFNNVGFLLKLAGQDQEAVSYLTRALQLNPQLTTSYENLSLVYQKLGNIKQAQSVLGQALFNDPAHADIYNHILNQLNK